MAVLFSTHFGDGDALAAIPNPRLAATAGIKHARVRTNICLIDATGEDPADNDVYRFCTMKSSDRVFSVKWSSDGVFSTGTDLAIGLHLAGDNHDGAVLDKDLFGAAADIGTDTDLTEVISSGAVTDEDAGKTLWEQYAVGDGSDIVDPLLDYDITGTIANHGAAGGIVLLMIQYTSGA